MFLSNLPLHILINAMRSRCALFIFAWILNTNAEKSSDIGSTSSLTVSLAIGEVVSCKNCSKNGSTPKFVSAEPKNTGVSFPSLTAWRLNSSPAPSSSSISSNKSCFKYWPRISSSWGSSSDSSFFSTSFWPLFAVNDRIFSVFLSNTPLNSLPEPIGQFTG